MYMHSVVKNMRDFAEANGLRMHYMENHVGFMVMQTVYILRFYNPRTKKTYVCHAPVFNTIQDCVELERCIMAEVRENLLKEGE